jgi:hypothetical protein
MPYGRLTPTLPQTPRAEDGGNLRNAVAPQPTIFTIYVITIENWHIFC